MPCYTNFFWATFFILYDPLEFWTGACPTPSGLEIGKTHHCVVIWNIYVGEIKIFHYFLTLSHLYVKHCLTSVNKSIIITVRTEFQILLFLRNDLISPKIPKNQVKPNFKALDKFIWSSNYLLFTFQIRPKSSRNHEVNSV